jgi:hypothetical protein
MIYVSMLVEDKLVVDTCKVNALEHLDVTNNLTCHKSILHFLIWDEVVQPILTELGDATHLEEVGGLHVAPDVVWTLAILALPITNAIYVLVLKLDGHSKHPGGPLYAVVIILAVSSFLYPKSCLLTWSHGSRLFTFRREVHQKVLILVRVNQLVDLIMTSGTTCEYGFSHLISAHI